MDHQTIITFDLTRAQKWQLYLIKGQTISIDDYVDLVKRSPFHNKLINDSFRTLKTNKDFQQKVPHTVITRVLNAAINHLSRFDSNETKFTYVQGMNVTMAPFLYTMNELPAFYCYINFIQNICPTYVQPNLDGVHAGVKIFDTIFKKLDFELYEYLRSKGLTSQIFAFSSIMTFSASQAPLDEVLLVWDFLVQNGFHFNILIVLAHLISLRTKLFTSDKPSHLLRNWPPIKAKNLINSARIMYLGLSQPIKELLKRHLTEKRLVEQLIGQ